jgi:hypothetical protein
VHQKDVADLDIDLKKQKVKATKKKMLKCKACKELFVVERDGQHFCGE